MHQTPKPVLSFVNTPSPWDMYCRFWCVKGPGPCAGGCRPLQKMGGPCMARRPQPRPRKWKTKAGAGKRNANPCAADMVCGPPRGPTCAVPEAGMRRHEAKTAHGARRAKCNFGLYFFAFSLDAAPFPAYNAYYVSSWPYMPMCQKYAENICAFRRFLPRQKGRLTRCYEEAEHAEKIRSGRKLW